MSTYPPPSSEAASLNIWEFLHIPPRGAELYRVLDAGFPVDVFAKLGEVMGLGRERLATVLDIAPATLQRRMKAGHFNRDESDRLFRLIKLMNQAIELFEGDIEAAHHWISHPVKGLGGKRPIDMMTTSAESDEVFNLIGRIEHGVFA